MSYTQNPTKREWCDSVAIAKEIKAEKKAKRDKVKRAKKLIESLPECFSDMDGQDTFKTYTDCYWCRVFDKCFQFTLVRAVAMIKKGEGAK